MQMGVMLQIASLRLQRVQQLLHALVTICQEAASAGGATPGSSASAAAACSESLNSSSNATAATSGSRYQYVLQQQNDWAGTGSHTLCRPCEGLSALGSDRLGSRRRSRSISGVPDPTRGRVGICGRAGSELAQQQQQHCAVWPTQPCVATRGCASAASPSRQYTSAEQDHLAPDGGGTGTASVPTAVAEERVRSRLDGAPLPQPSNAPACPSGTPLAAQLPPEVPPPAVPEAQHDLHLLQLQQQLHQQLQRACTFHDLHAWLTHALPAAASELVSSHPAAAAITTAAASEPAAAQPPVSCAAGNRSSDVPHAHGHGPAKGAALREGQAALWNADLAVEFAARLAGAPGPTASKRALLELCVPAWLAPRGGNIPSPSRRHRQRASARASAEAGAGRDISAAASAAMPTAMQQLVAPLGPTGHLGAFPVLGAGAALPLLPSPLLAPPLSLLAHHSASSSSSSSSSSTPRSGAAAGSTAVSRQSSRAPPGSAPAHKPATRKTSEPLPPPCVLTSATLPQSAQLLRCLLACGYSPGRQLMDALACPSRREPSGPLSTPTAHPTQPGTGSGVGATAGSVGTESTTSAAYDAAAAARAESGSDQELALALATMLAGLARVGTLDSPGVRSLRALAGSLDGGGPKNQYLLLRSLPTTAVLELHMELQTAAAAAVRQVGPDCKHVAVSFGAMTTLAGVVRQLVSERRPEDELRAEEVAALAERLCELVAALRVQRQQRQQKVAVAGAAHVGGGPLSGGQDPAESKPPQQATKARGGLRDLLSDVIARRASVVYKQSAALVAHLQQLQQRQEQLASETPPVRSAHGRGKDRGGRSSAARAAEVEERELQEATQATLEAARGTARELSALVRAALAINTLAEEPLVFPMDEAHVDRPPFSKWPLDEQAWAGLVWHMQEALGSMLLSAPDPANHPLIPPTATLAIGVHDGNHQLPPRMRRAVVQALLECAYPLGPDQQLQLMQRVLPSEVHPPKRPKWMWPGSPPPRMAGGAGKDLVTDRATAAAQAARDEAAQDSGWRWDGRNVDAGALSPAEGDAQPLQHAASQQAVRSTVTHGSGAATGTAGHTTPPPAPPPSAHLPGVPPAVSEEGPLASSATVLRAAGGITLPSLPFGLPLPAALPFLAIKGHLQAQELRDLLRRVATSLGDVEEQLRLHRLTPASGDMYDMYGNAQSDGHAVADAASPASGFLVPSSAVDKAKDVTPQRLLQCIASSAALVRGSAPSPVEAQSHGGGGDGATEKEIYRAATDVLHTASRLAAPYARQSTHVAYELALPYSVHGECAAEAGILADVAAGAELKAKEVLAVVEAAEAMGIGSAEAGASMRGLTQSVGQLSLMLEALACNWYQLPTDSGLLPVVEELLHDQEVLSAAGPAVPRVAAAAAWLASGQEASRRLGQRMGPASGPAGGEAAVAEASRRGDTAGAAAERLLEWTEMRLRELLWRRRGQQEEGQVQGQDSQAVVNLQMALALTAACWSVGRMPSAVQQAVQDAVSKRRRDGQREAERAEAEAAQLLPVTDSRFNRLPTEWRMQLSAMLLDLGVIQSAEALALFERALLHEMFPRLRDPHRVTRLVGLMTRAALAGRARDSSHHQEQQQQQKQQKQGWEGEWEGTQPGQGGSTALACGGAEARGGRGEGSAASMLDAVVSVFPKLATNWAVPLDVVREVVVSLDRLGRLTEAHVLALTDRLLRELNGKADGELEELLRNLAPPGALRQGVSQPSAQATVGSDAGSGVTGEQLRDALQEGEQLQHSTEPVAVNANPGDLAQLGNQLSHDVDAEMEAGAELPGRYAREQKEGREAGDGAGDVHPASMAEQAGSMGTHTSTTSATTGATASSSTRLFATDPHLDETAQLWVRLCHQHYVHHAARQRDGSEGTALGAAEGSGGDGSEVGAQAGATGRPARAQELPAGPFTGVLLQASGTLLRQLFAGGAVGAGTALRLDRDTLVVAVQLATHPALAKECAAIGEAWTGWNEAPTINPTSGARTRSTSSARHGHHRGSGGLLGLLRGLPALQAADVVEACLAPHVVASARAQEAWQGVLGPCLGRLYAAGMAGARRSPEAAAMRLEAVLSEGVQTRLPHLLRSVADATAAMAQQAERDHDLAVSRHPVPSSSHTSAPAAEADREGPTPPPFARSLTLHYPNLRDVLVAAAVRAALSPAKEDGSDVRQEALPYVMDVLRETARIGAELARAQQLPAPAVPTAAADDAVGVTGAQDAADATGAQEAVGSPGSAAAPLGRRRKQQGLAALPQQELAVAASPFGAFLQKQQQQQLAQQHTQEQQQVPQPTDVPETQPLGSSSGPVLGTAPGAFPAIAKPPTAAPTATSPLARELGRLLPAAVEAQWHTWPLEALAQLGRDAARLGAPTVPWVCALAACRQVADRMGQLAEEAQALERDVAGQKVVDEVRTEAYLNKKYRQQRLLLKQQQQQQQGQAQAQGQEQGQKQAQAQGQEQGQGQAQLQAQAQEQGQKQAQAQGQAQGQEQGQKQAQGQGQGQGQLSQADEAAVLPGEATEGLPGAKAGPLGEGAAPELVSAPEEQELGQQAAGAGLSDAELEEGEELVQQAAGAELSDVELEEGEEAGLSLLQEEAVSKWSQPYKPNFWDRHPALEGRLQAARGECLALVKQLSEMLLHVAVGDGASLLRGRADPGATRGLHYAVQGPADAVHLAAALPARLEAAAAAAGHRWQPQPLHGWPQPDATVRHLEQQLSACFPALSSALAQLIATQQQGSRAVEQQCEDGAHMDAVASAIAQLAAASHAAPVAARFDLLRDSALALEARGMGHGALGEALAGLAGEMVQELVRVHGAGREVQAAGVHGQGRAKGRGQQRGAGVSDADMEAAVVRAVREVALPLLRLYAKGGVWATGVEVPGAGVGGGKEAEAGVGRRLKRQQQEQGRHPLAPLLAALEQDAVRNRIIALELKQQRRPQPLVLQLQQQQQQQQQEHQPLGKAEAASLQLQLLLACVHAGYLQGQLVHGLADAVLDRLVGVKHVEVGQAAAAGAAMQETCAPEHLLASRGHQTEAGHGGEAGGMGIGAAGAGSGGILGQTLARVKALGLRALVGQDWGHEREQGQGQQAAETQGTQAAADAPEPPVHGHQGPAFAAQAGGRDSSAAVSGPGSGHPTEVVPESRVHAQPQPWTLDADALEADTIAAMDLDALLRAAPALLLLHNAAPASALTFGPADAAGPGPPAGPHAAGDGAAAVQPPVRGRRHRLRGRAGYLAGPRPAQPAVAEGGPLLPWGGEDPALPFVLQGYTGKGWMGVGQHAAGTAPAGTATPHRGTKGYEVLLELLRIAVEGEARGTASTGNGGGCGGGSGAVASPGALCALAHAVSRAHCSDNRGSGGGGAGGGGGEASALPPQHFGRLLGKLYGSLVQGGGGGGGAAAALGPYASAGADSSTAAAEAAEAAVSLARLLACGRNLGDPLLAQVAELRLVGVLQGAARSPDAARAVLWAMDELVGEGRTPWFGLRRVAPPAVRVTSGGRAQRQQQDASGSRTALTLRYEPYSIRTGPAGDVVSALVHEGGPELAAALAGVVEAGLRQHGGDEAVDGLWLARAAHVLVWASAGPSAVTGYGAGGAGAAASPRERLAGVWRGLVERAAGPGVGPKVTHGSDETAGGQAGPQRTVPGDEVVELEQEPGQGQRDEEEEGSLLASSRGTGGAGLSAMAAVHLLAAGEQLGVTDPRVSRLLAAAVLEAVAAEAEELGCGRVWGAGLEDGDAEEEGQVRQGA